jgi:ribosomal protein S6--L-glutamate ligase
MVICSPADVRARFNELNAGDVVAGRLPADFLLGAPAVDLLERGVRFLPSILSQRLSRSKTGQALVLAAWMLPHTRVIPRRAALMEAVGYCAQQGIGVVVTKQEGKHCGHGVRRWESLESLYNVVAFSESAFPFVLQPFVAGLIDVRVIWVGDYVEAYRRENRFNFRANLSSGGESTVHELGPAEKALCRSVMDRARFPYAHIDLQLTSEGRCHLAEISLDAGASGARVGREELLRMKQEQIERLLTGAC